MQLRVPVKDPFTIPTDDPFTEKVCCQFSLQLPPLVHVVEQLNMVSVKLPVESVAHVAAVGFWPHALLVVQTVLVQESCSATFIPLILIGDLVESTTWYGTRSLRAVKLVPVQVMESDEALPTLT
jgi:hypothetical protein